MSMEAGSYLGLKYGVIIGGFAGAVMSLRFMKELTPVSAAIAVFSGTAVAHFFAIPVSIRMGRLLEMPPDDIEGATAFLLGLCALNLVAGVVTLSERFKANPGSFKKGE